MPLSRLLSPFTLKGATSGTTKFLVADAVSPDITFPSATSTLATLGTNTFVGNQAITGALTVSTTLGVTGTVTLSNAVPLFLSGGAAHPVNAYGATTGYTAFAIASNGGTSYLGIESSTGGTLVVGSAAYSTIVGMSGARSLHLVTNNTVRATIDSAGAVTIPGTLGVSTGAAVGGATPGAGGLAFPATAVAVADANTLDDYEEGDWTASWVPSTSGSINNNALTLTYTKIGRVVHIGGYDSVASVSAPVGQLTLSGLPYTGASGNKYASATPVQASGLSSAAITSLCGFVDSGGSGLIIVKFATGTSSVLAGDVQAGTAFRLGGSYVAA